MNGVKYSIARIAIFLACLGLGWVVGLRDPLILLLVAATVSLVISLFVLSGMRERFAREVADNMEHREAAREAARARKAAPRNDIERDNYSEDAEIDATIDAAIDEAYNEDADSFR